MPGSMLPILRIIPVGGVLLALLILVLALKPPERPLPPGMVSARGALIDPSAHPEWRQFLVQAALRRADEVDRLRDLLEIAARAVPAASTGSARTTETVIAGLPATREDSEPDPEDVTSSIITPPTIPVEIGATSSFELPVAVPEESAPVPLPPQRAQPSRESQLKPVRKVRRAKVKKPQAPQEAETHMPPPLNLLEKLFSSASTAPAKSAKGGQSKGAQDGRAAPPAQTNAGLN